MCTNLIHSKVYRERLASFVPSEPESIRPCSEGTANIAASRDSAGAYSLFRRFDLAHRSGPVDERVAVDSRDVLRGDKNIVAIGHRCGVVTPTSCQLFVGWD